MTLKTHKNVEKNIKNCRHFFFFEIYSVLFSKIFCQNCKILVKKLLNLQDFGKIGKTN